ncbi:hypothetical protein C8Q78DRAFT_962979 [Trametes maxima]|nr:hypothetical protein C8Q78DRAFT_962979 [Trametes maxima]
MRVPEHLAQTNQTGETLATIVATRLANPSAALVQETDSRTVMQALTAFRSRNEDAGYIGVKNADLLRLAVAELRARRAKTAFRWVKGHSGHPNNEKADELAGKGAEMPYNEPLEMTIPAALKLTGAKLSCMTQKRAYKAIRCLKAKKLEQRRATHENMRQVVVDIKEACGREVTAKAVWASLRGREFSREYSQFMWKLMHDAYFVGEKWYKPRMPDALRERAVCKVCGETESMRHILLSCRACGRGEIWALLEKTWGLTGLAWVAPSWGTVVGAACIPVRTGPKGLRDAGKEGLWMTLWAESVHLIWKMRCERVIQNDGREFTQETVTNRWYAAIKQRVDLDRCAASRALGKKALNPRRVGAIWRPVLESLGDDELPDDWVLNNGVLVGIRRA